MGATRKTLNLDIDLKNELNQSIGNLAEALHASFLRLPVNNEHHILKIDTFVEELKTKKELSLDGADEKLFKDFMLNCDAFQLVKSAALKAINQMNNGLGPDPT